MKIPRRNFLAVLFAPILAKFAPKPKCERVFDDALLKKAYLPRTLIDHQNREFVSKAEWFWNGPYGILHGTSIDGGPIEWKRSPIMPFTKFQRPDEWPWDVKTKDLPSCGHISAVLNCAPCEAWGFRERKA